VPTSISENSVGTKITRIVCPSALSGFADPLVDDPAGLTRTTTEASSPMTNASTARRFRMGPLLARPFV